MLLRLNVRLNLLDEATATHVVNEVEHDQGDAKLKLNLVDEFVLGQEGSCLLGLIYFVCLVDEVAEQRLFLVLGLKLL